MLMRWLAGGANGLAKAVADTLQARANADLERHKAEVGGDTQIALQRLQAEIDANKIKADIRAREGHWGLTAIVAIVLFAIPSGLHYWAVVLDSVCGLWSDPNCVGSWRIAALPGQFAGIEREIILSFFITGGAVTIARLFARRG
jgi:hypothetical protein